MSPLRIIVREIGFRPGSFALAVTSVAVAVGCVAGAWLGLAGHDLRTNQILSAREAEVEASARELEDTYRKITKAMGYNVLVLPNEQNLADFHADDYASKYMPEDYADRLASSSVVTVNHLLPSLQQKVHWPEKRRTILLVGTKGQVPIAHRDPKKPIQEAVPRGRMVIGSELHRVLDLDAGDKTALFGREFIVDEVHPERGTKDDITVWIHLDEAQELLGKRGLINGILALECNCPGDGDARLSLIRKEITTILPDTQVIALQSKSEARVQARRTAHSAALEALEREREGRKHLRTEHEKTAAAVVPLALFVSCVWIGLLALGNARARAAEIGILRAVGIGRSTISSVFLGRAIIVGITGAVIGLALGVFAGGPLAGLGVAEAWALVSPALLVGSLIGAPLLALAATWIPARVASRQDPAVVLQDD